MAATPLLDVFRRGEAPRDLKLLAAQGALAPRAHEQVALLILLVADGDADIASAAEATLQAIPRDALGAFLARTDVPADVRSFFAARGVEGAGVPAEDADAPLIDIGTMQEAQAEDTTRDRSALQRIAAMNIAQRIALAMKGSREERAILIRDPNKIVAASVLGSPKLTDTEVENVARMANVSEEILRIIAHTRAWVKNYAVVAALTRNPKTPVALSMNLIARLSERDLRALSTDRNVPDVLRIAARKKMVLNK